MRRVRRWRTGVVVALACAAAWPGPALSAQDADEPAWPAALDARVRRMVADAWDTHPDSVVLRWARAPEEVGIDTPREVSGVDLLGSGRGGYWVVQLRRSAAASVSVRVRAGVRARRPVAALRLERGHQVTDTDVTWTPWVVWGRPDAAPRADPTGWVTQRVVEEGAPLQEPAVRPADAVTTGQTVEAWYRTGSVGVRIVARAQSGGPIGARVHVRTADGRRLEGVVAGPGVVELVHTGPYRGPGGES